MIADIKIDVKTSKESNVSEGKLFYFDQGLFLEITSPLHQIMFFSGKQLTIYYPESNKAFIINSKFPQMLPLFSIFLMILEDDMGLSKLGFVVSKVVKKKDGKYFYFIPVKKLQKLIQYYIVKVSNNGNISYIKVTNRKKKVISETFIFGYKLINNLKLPNMIKTKKYDDKKNLISTETMVMSDIISDGLIPIKIKNFKIPDDAEIKEIEW